MCRGKSCGYLKKWCSLLPFFPLPTNVCVSVDLCWSSLPPTFRPPLNYGLVNKTSEQRRDKHDRICLCSCSLGASVQRNGYEALCSAASLGKVATILTLQLKQHLLLFLQHLRADSKKVRSGSCYLVSHWLLSSWHRALIRAWSQMNFLSMSILFIMLFFFFNLFSHLWISVRLSFASKLSALRHKVSLASLK